MDVYISFYQLMILRLNKIKSSETHSQHFMDEEQGAEYKDETVVVAEAVQEREDDNCSRCISATNQCSLHPLRGQAFHSCTASASALVAEAVQE